MATLKAVVRTARADGFYPVYIRVTHHRASSFIKTDKMVTKKELTKNKEIKDPFVMQYCTQRILEYTERLNKKNIENWTVAEVVEYLENADDDICFSDYAHIHINRMIDRGEKRNVEHYTRHHELRDIHRLLHESFQFVFTNLFHCIVVLLATPFWSPRLHASHGLFLSCIACSI